MNLEEDVGWNWFKNRVVRKVDNSHFTSFWRDKWVGNAPFVMHSLTFSLFLLKKRLWWGTFGP